MHALTFHPRALLVIAACGALLCAANSLQWTIFLVGATVVYDWLSFAGVFGTRRR